MNVFSNFSVGIINIMFIATRAQIHWDSKYLSTMALSFYTAHGRNSTCSYLLFEDKMSDKFKENNLIIMLERKVGEKFIIMI